MTRLARTPFFDGRATPLAGPTFLHINTLARSVGSILACEQALRGAPGREKEGEFATTSLEFEHYVSNDVITLGTCFSMFVYIRARFCFSLIDGNLTAQSTGSHRRIVGGIQILLHFPAPPPGRPESLLAG